MSPNQKELYVCSDFLFIYSIPNSARKAPAGGATFQSSHRASRSRGGRQSCARRRPRLVAHAAARTLAHTTPSPQLNSPASVHEPQATSTRPIEQDPSA
eukprot:6214810-Pleurochrysis_carterae.AAC.4